MSQITVMVCDCHRSISSQPHYCRAELIIATLSAEPETIEELDSAQMRFVEADHREDFDSWSPRGCEEPYDAGICIVELSARVLVCESTAFQPLRLGEYEYNGTTGRDAIWIPYRIPEDWVVLDRLEGWRSVAQRRRDVRQAVLPLDPRPVLYGQVCPFIVAECAAALVQQQDGVWKRPPGWSFRELPQRATCESGPMADDAIAEIHARWLMEPRADLQGKRPRDWLVARQNALSLDLSDREIEWSRTGRQPPPLSRDAYAYRYAGIGPHEFVLYYDLVRELTRTCFERFTEKGVPSGDAQRAEAARWLSDVRETWLQSPLEDGSGDMIPSEVLEQERQRIPTAGDGSDMIDDDCPMCQMIAEGGFGPCFWHLDTCNFDEEYPFSAHLTGEAYEEEQRRETEFRLKWEAECREREAETGSADEESVWQRSYSSNDLPAQGKPGVMSIGFHFSELLEDLTEAGNVDAAESLRHHFSNLLGIDVEPDSALLAPVVERFAESLDAVGQSQPGLLAKIDDLKRRLTQLAGDEEVPW